MNVPDHANTVELLKRLDRDLTRMRVLVVDRHTSARNSLRIILSALGVSAVHGAATTAEVLRQIKGNAFDIIFADYQLDDGRDGQQLLEELRHRRLIPQATVYMVITAERAYHNVVSVAELAPDDYLIKPFTSDQLHSRLIKAIYKKRFFEPVFALLDKNAFVDALTACQTLIGREELFAADTLRCKGEILNLLGRHEEAQALYRAVIAEAPAPWARMGLAVAARGLGQLADAEALSTSLIIACPEYLAAYDFVASVREERGKPIEAQAVLEKAAEISPNNSLRQRLVGDVAFRNDDLDTAERAYGKVLERHRGSSLKVIDDYANLGRVLIGKGRSDAARAVAKELRRDWRGNAHGELAALIMDSLCAGHDGESGQARVALDKALAVHGALPDDDAMSGFSAKIAVDLAHACLASGDDDTAHGILGKLAAENHEDRGLIAQIESVFEKTGKADAGRTLLARVGKEIIELNNRGVLAARGGNLEASVRMLSEAAERVPNLQFLVNASKAIFALLDSRGWNEDLAQRAVRYLRMAQAKDLRNVKVISAREIYHQVARKYGIEVVAISAVRGPFENKR